MRWLAIGLFSFLLVNPCYADLEQEMSSLFADMVNTTPPGYYDTQRRGVITGGNLAMRNRVLHPNLVSFVPPSFKGGCGGIDLFGGSFSYINGAQFTALLRSVAQGAVGYAFQLAIEGMCPTCAQVMTKLQKDVAEINALMKNSCEASKLMVNATGLRVWHDKQLDDAAELDTSKGYLADYFESKETKNPNQVALANGAADQITTNVVYDALKDAVTYSWFTHGDDQLQRVLMSLTGTMIIGKKADNSDIQYDYRQPTLDVRDFIEGGTLKIYTCADDECLLSDNNPTETVSITGMRQKVHTLLFGSCNCVGGSGGIIRKLTHRDQEEALDSNEEQFIKTSSPGVLGVLHRVAAQPGSATLIGEQMVGLLATNLTNQIIDEMYQAVMDSINATGKPLDSAMLNVMQSRRQQIDDERRLNGETTEAIANLLNTLNDVEQALHTTTHRHL